MFNQIPLSRPSYIPSKPKSFHNLNNLTNLNSFNTLNIQNIQKKQINFTHTQNNLHNPPKTPLIHQRSFSNHMQQIPTNIKSKRQIQRTDNQQKPQNLSLRQESQDRIPTQQRFFSNESQNYGQNPIKSQNQFYKQNQFQQQNSSIRQNQQNLLNQSFYQNQLNISSTQGMNNSTKYQQINRLNLIPNPKKNEDKTLSFQQESQFTPEQLAEKQKEMEALKNELEIKEQIHRQNDQQIIANLSLIKDVNDASKNMQLQMQLLDQEDYYHTIMQVAFENQKLKEAIQQQDKDLQYYLNMEQRLIETKQQNNALQQTYNQEYNF